MTRFARHISILLFLFCFSFSFAQPLGIKSYQVNEEGNPPRILSLTRHSKGFMLTGTSAGLYRFNGHNFLFIPFADSVSSTAITSLAEDKAGFVWIGFQNGLIGTTNLKTVKLLQPEEGYPKAAITSIRVGNDGVVYFATAGEGIYYYRNKRLYNINTDDGLSDNYVYHMLLYAGGVIAGTDRGINTVRLDGSKKVIRTFTTANGLPDNIVRTLYSHNNGCWIGMQDNGIGNFNPPAQTYFSPAMLTPWKYGQVNSIISQRQQMWVATEDNGVVVVNYADTNMVRPLHTRTVSGFSKTSNLLNDHEGNLWFTSNHQLVKTAGAQLQQIIPLTSKEFTEAHAILCDSKQNIWINHNTGLRRYNIDTIKGTWTAKEFRLPAISATTDISSIYEDAFGHIWIGTMGKGVFIIDPVTGKNRNLTEDHLLVDGSVLSINGKGNHVWISSLGGAVLCRLNERNRDINQLYDFQNFNRVSGIGSNYIYSIFVDSKERVWFGTDGKGLTLMDGGRFITFNEKQDIKSLVVYNICEDNVGNIWFSTNSGLHVFDGHKFKNISVEQGLNDPVITALAVDAKGSIVAISKKGINLVDANTHVISYLDDNQGLTDLNTDLNCISRNGDNLYFLTSQGIIQYTASYTTLQPMVILEQVKLYDRDVDIVQEHEFSYDENNFSFFFSGISFSHPDKIRYQLKLEGFSGDWMYTKENFINFPRLPAGTYTFRLRSSLSQNFNEANEVTYTFTIKKPLWQQWWFIGLIIVVIGSMLYWYIKDREQRVKRWERLEKEKIQSQFETLKSQVNPHFLFNSFNTLISVIEENPDTAVEYVEHLSDLYRKIVIYRDKDTITLEEEVQLIHDYFFIQQKRFGNNLQLHVNITELGMQQFRIAPLTLQLLCENAVKHNAISATTPLAIEITAEGDWLVVKNNINPKFTTEKGAGMGLQNIQKRYQLLSGKEIKIDNTGQYFIVYIPLLSA